LGDLEKGLNFSLRARKSIHRVRVFEKDQEPSILCLGAHPDDIEIGCGGTLLRLMEELPKAQFYWVVLSGDEKRRKEAYESAGVFLRNARVERIVVQGFRESYFPFAGAKIKDYFGKLGKESSPDLVFTHHSGDAHQDHRVVSDLTWNTFRNHFILEYEVPKYDGDLKTPNWYVLLEESHVKRKIDYLLDVFQTQKQKPWFDEETFRSILRIRGIESQSPSRYAEGFYCRKTVL
jgi:LmbE family N-acetylglucosaminyl deacetylase